MIRTVLTLAFVFGAASANAADIGKAPAMAPQVAKVAQAAHKAKCAKLQKRDEKAEAKVAMGKRMEAQAKTMQKFSTGTTQKVGQVMEDAARKKQTQGERKVQKGQQAESRDARKLKNSDC